MTRRRPAFTLLEVIVVMAILTIIGALILPSLVGMRGNTGLKAGVDSVRARMLEARTRAMDDGIAYRLLLSNDGRSLQVMPDDPAAAEALVMSGTAGAAAVGGASAVGGMSQTTGTGGTFGPSQDDQLPIGITARVQAQNGVEATIDQSGWIRVATFTPEGTCREDLVEVVVTDEAMPNYPITIRIRGVTGAIRTVRSGGMP